jgi:peptide methionine sulfoxide reductase MsrA
MGGAHPAHPTYKSLGDHTEVVRVRLERGAGEDEQKALVERFLEMVSPARPTTRTQYKNAVWCTSSKDADLVRSVFRAWAANNKKACEIPIVQGQTPFHLAEDYHQKYELRNSSIGKRCGVDLGDSDAVINTKSATKWNAVCSGALEGEAFSLTESEKQSEQQRNEQRS